MPKAATMQLWIGALLPLSYAASPCCVTVLTLLMTLVRVAASLPHTSSRRAPG